jgi:hypothetical protein
MANRTKLLILTEINQQVKAEIKILAKSKTKPEKTIKKPTMALLIKPLLAKNSLFFINN